MIDTPIESFTRIRLPQKKALERLGISNVNDLLFYFPSRYQFGSIQKKVRELVSGDTVILFGKLAKLTTKKAWRTKIPMTEATFSDETGNIKLIWFHQAFIGKTHAVGDFVKIAGKVQSGKYGVYISNPEIEKIAENEVSETSKNMFEDSPLGGSIFYPIYPETRGLTSRWFFHAIDRALKQGAHEEVTDPIPQHILTKYNLPSLSSSLVWIHQPKKESDHVAARKRFSFQEMFFIQLERQQDRALYAKNPPYVIDEKKKELQNFIKSFPFPLTKAQERAVDAILKDMQGASPMSRLLEGDVGSGKTAVSAIAAYAATCTSYPGHDFGHLQTAYMVPTEILAKQQFDSFIENFRGSPVQIGLITGHECRKFPSKIDPEGHTNISRAQLLRWVKNGEIPIVVGTHALIYDTVEFKHLALVVIDEQHRFGVAQRAKLARKGSGGKVPHLLSMTATPIPRTLALTIYGDLDLTLLDELPPGRKQVKTEIVPPQKREDVYKKIKEELKSGRQAYVICPRIDEPDPEKEQALRVTSAKSEAERLQKEVFSDYTVGLVHSKLKKDEKEKVMNDFTNGDIDILTSTSVVEVGVNVPNATVIVIEGAERFGLAQLHQLRGRVLRSTYQAHCYLFTDSKTKKTTERLSALVTSKNGFELAEKDLEYRGEGALSGTKQWGMSDLGMAGIKNIKMVEAAQEVARKIVEKDPELKKYPELKNALSKKETKIHFE